METLTQDQFKQRYGTIGTLQFKDEDKERNLFDSIKEAAATSFNKQQQGFSEMDKATNPVQLLEGGTKAAAGSVGVAFSPFAPITNKIGEYAGKVLNPIVDKISNSKAVQKFAESKAGQTTARVAEDVGNANEIAGAFVAPEVGGRALRGASRVGSEVADAASSIKGPDFGGMAKNVQGAIRDVVPNSQSLIDHNLAKALDLTPGDLIKIETSTGNPVGKWLSDNNLIGTNKLTTEGMIGDFFRQNYATVREEIGKVKSKYEPSKVPRYEETLKAIQAETQGKLGLEKVNDEITSLLKKKVISLEDVQRTKELLDEHFNLYKMTGDVAQGVQKQGLANVRTDLKKFIEDEVKTNTGADIGLFNNNVATARGILDSIEARSTRGLTRAHFTTRDWMMGMGLTYFGSPLLGIAFVFGKKIATSPTARLRLARFLDQRGDAYKARVSEALSKGEVPKELEKAIETP